MIILSQRRSAIFFHLAMVLLQRLSVLTRDEQTPPCAKGAIYCRRYLSAELHISSRPVSDILLPQAGSGSGDADL